MSIRLTVTLAISLLILGASYAFADGILNDASTTRAHGGVGNYLFWSMRDLANGPAGKNELVNSAASFENEASPNRFDELRVRQSSAVAPLRAVRFESGSARIEPTEGRELSAIAETLRTDPGLKADITGFSDSVGTASKNESLASARAEAVVRDLKARGVSENQLSWHAKGEADPASENDTTEGRARNRRVEVQFE